MWELNSTQPKNEYEFSSTGNESEIIFIFFFSTVIIVTGVILAMVSLSFICKYIFQRSHQDAAGPSLPNISDEKEFCATSYVDTHSYRIQANKSGFFFVESKSNDTNDVESQIEKRVAQVSSETCAICLDDFNLSDLVVLLDGCTHCFHQDCISLWLERSQKCPYCRFEICDKT